VLWARGCPPGPLSPGAYKYPPWGSTKGISRALASSCYLILEVVVVVVSFFF